MEYILYAVLAYLGFTSLVLLRNWVDFRGLKDLNPESPTEPPLISICIPARNEETVIKRCVSSALLQDYSNIEVLVLDDNSTDQTPLILSDLAAHHPNLRTLQGKPKPDDWLGKPWACHQLSSQANGRYLVFIDADVWLAPDAITQAATALTRSDAITVWPQQQFGSFWERMVIPLIYHALFTLLPAKYVERKPRWLPQKLYPLLKTNFAAACGQFIAFNQKAYQRIGGHQGVKDEIVEDVALARQLKSHDCSLTMYHGAKIVHCRMYLSHQELFSGLRKNFFAGFGKKPIPFIAMALLSIMVFVVPFVGLFLQSLITLKLSIAAVGVIWWQRWMLDYRFGWNPLFSLLHPISVLWYQVLGITCLRDYFTGKPAQWKGRDV